MELAARKSAKDIKYEIIKSFGGGARTVRRIKVKKPDRCVGCLNCMLACARDVFKVFSWDRSAIKVKTMGGLETGEFDITVCRRCHDPPCTEACPTGALYRGEEGRMKFDPDKCTGSKKCIDACIVNAITFDETIKKPRICIHCGACARACPHEVLELEKIEGV